MMTKKQPHAVTAVTQALIKVGHEHGLDAVHAVYRETVAELMACETRDVWRARISESQLEAFAQIEAR